MSGILNIALSGLNDAATRAGNAASNIVNASSTSKIPTDSENYAGYTPQDVITLSNDVGSNNLSVTDTTTPRDPAYTTTYAPNSANANTQGLIAAPNVDVSSELVTLKTASVNYAANAAVIKITDKTEKALLDITT